LESNKTGSALDFFFKNGGELALGFMGDELIHELLT